jgi:myo-inositol 2-dehydrogenase/D-chiro-inositol 1-dehydrogenase
MSTVAIYADGVSTTANGVIRYGVIGTGMMGVEHIRNLLHLPQAEVVAICDTNEESLRRAAGLFQDSGVAQFSDYRDVLAVNGIDVLVIATPNHTHVDIVLNALETRCHILIEKPLCTSVLDCLRVIEKESEVGFADRVVWVGLEYRYMPVTAELLSRVASREVGDVKMISIREHRFPFLKKVEDWNRFNKNTGGTLVEKCCHFFDLMCIAADSEPKQVFASGSQSVNHLEESYGGLTPDILDNAFVIVDFENGVRAHLDLCMFAEASKNEQEICVVGDIGKLEALVSESTIRLGLRSQGIGAFNEVLISANSPYEGFHHGASYWEHVRLQEAIWSRNKPEVSLRDGLRSVAIGAAAHMSIAENRVVSISEVIDV